MGKQRRGNQRSLGEMLDLSQRCRSPTCERERKEGWIGRVLGGSAVLTNFQLGLWGVLQRSPSEESHNLWELSASVLLPSLLFESSRGMHGLCACIVMHSDPSSWSYQSIMLLVAGDLRALFHGPPSFLFPPCFPSFLFSVKMFGVLFRL